MDPVSASNLIYQNSIKTLQGAVVQLDQNVNTTSITMLLPHAQTGNTFTPPSLSQARAHGYLEWLPEKTCDLIVT